MNLKCNLIFFLLLNSIYVAVLKGEFAEDKCWKSSYGRGAGVPLSTCEEGYELNGLLCYPKCAQGYYGVGPVCWENCAPGFQDDGITCAQHVHIYGKGCCCILNNCCHNCPDGYTDDGCTCRKPPNIYLKKSYGRSTGKPMQCKNDEEQSGALCYPKCSQGYIGIGPVCWKYCDGKTAVDCGAACASDALVCAALTKDLIYKGLSVITTIALGELDPNAVSGTIKSYAMRIC